MKINCGSNIKHYRSLNNFSQTDLGNALNVSHNTISSWETNRTEPNIGQIEKMAAIFNCKKTDLIGNSVPAYLMGWDEDVSAQSEAIYESFQKNAVAFGVISKEESELLELFRSASEDKKVSILNVVRALVE